MRAGTRKSRAPSGVERVRNGVSISRKSRSSSTLRIVWIDAVAQLQRLAHRRAAQVERAMAQAEVLVDGTVLVDLERRRLGVGEDLDLRDVDLDLAGDQVRVDVLGLAGDDACRRR